MATWLLAFCLAILEGSLPCSGTTTNTGGTYSVNFIPDGMRFVTGHGDGSVKVWDIARLVRETDK